MNDVEALTTPWDRIWGWARVHWSAPTWSRTAHVATGLPIALAVLAAILGLVAASVLLVWTLVTPVVALLLLTFAVPLFTRLQRARFQAFLRVDIPRVPPRRRSRNPFKTLVREARTGSTWRQLAYHLLAPLIGLVAFLGVVVAWSACLVGIAVSVHLWRVGGRWGVVVSAACTLALLVVVPWVARGITALDVIAAEALLGPSRSDLLAQRVESLRESRAEVVDAADAERRRLERDLHDGTQQRLVSLAMNLGLARTTLADLPDPAREVIVQAHEEAKQALKELRDLVRGLHPAVLNDQGLDAALSGIAARAPFPVRLDVEVAERVSPTIEAVAFFVVSEALTNIAKHAHASRAEITVRRRDRLLHVTVHDDGGGGAHPNGGTGLRGLAQRVGSVDGTLSIDSPAGGPTTIAVELPCE
ncbi:sensor histidine kinase [Streptosporangium carneum]|uniref:histidine kinase n=1 Tax=Streptosporangium carneum TaxID=47481 RepID=A0A9W6MIL4_9ACTN|nr:sensor histidine kinase [Streptosporangium carneum]GLK15417.1 histidine kinase [Streptosporangium carneum]